MSPAHLRGILFFHCSRSLPVGSSGGRFWSDISLGNNNRMAVIDNTNSKTWAAGVRHTKSTGHTAHLNRIATATTAAASNANSTKSLLEII